MPQPLPQGPTPSSAATAERASMTVTLPAVPASVARARRLVGAFAAGSRVRPDDLALLVSEVVTNALQHGRLGVRGLLRVEAELHGDNLRVVVHDGGPGRKSMVRPDAGGHGHGLRIVNRLAAAWGSGPDTVWFEL